MDERIAGPFRGYHVALYAFEMGDSGCQYLGYYKICTGEPSSYFEARGLLKGCCEGTCATVQGALDAAQLLARLQIGNMPLRDELAAYQENRALHWYEREVLEGPVSAAN